MSLTLFFEEFVVLLMDANGRNGRAVGNEGVRRGCGLSWWKEDVGDVGDASGEDTMGAACAALKAGTVTVIAVVREGWEMGVLVNWLYVSGYMSTHAF